MAYGYSYGPPGENQKAKEAEASSMEGEPRGCCWCTGLSLEQQMTRYVLVMAATFGAFLGPFSGVLMAAAVSGPDAKLYINAITTLIFFIISLALVIRPSMRILSRLWLLAGFAWVLAGWITYFRKEFSEMPERWLVVTVVQSCVYGMLGFIPLFTTDPISVSIFT